MKSLRSSLALLLSLALSPLALAQAFNADLSLKSVTVESYTLVGSTLRIYAEAENLSSEDLTGVVKFYDEKAQKFIGQDQPISVLRSNGVDQVFVDWKPKEVGNTDISVRLVPWNPEGDDSSNNKQTVRVVVDSDSDKDGSGNLQDADDDNDGIPDTEDTFPFDAAESLDTDSDKLGDNADPDDDNDGVEDAQDFFSKDGTETVDTDADGVGDNGDAFPTDPTESIDTDQDGLGDNADLDDTNMGPQAVIQTKESVVSTGEAITFNALTSTDADGDIVKYEWDFGDGQKQEGVVVDHIFQKTGQQQVILIVTDNKNEQRTTSIGLTVVHRWQTIALAILALLLFLLLLFHLLLGRKSQKEEDDLEESIGATNDISASSQKAKKSPSAKKKSKNLPRSKK